MTKFKGLALNIGSFPFKEADKALDLIFDYTPNIPCWPQLPKRSVLEGMVAQFSQGFPCIKITKEGLYFDEASKDEELEKFYEDIIVKDTGVFKISEDFAPGLWKFYHRLENSDLSRINFIKCQSAGPFTFAAGINTPDGKTLLHDKVFMQAILKGLSMKALWQVELFKKFGKDIILFFDEPYLGCFGSAYTPLNREDVISGLREMMGAVKSKGLILGVHCCGNTDWSMLTEVPEIDIISFDAYDFLEKLTLYAQDIAKFLKRGGALCWGIVPTQEFSSAITKDALLNKLKAGINAFENKGISANLLQDSMLLSPSCGLGSLHPDKCEGILRVLADLSAQLL